ncbi:hypothetical protein GC163_00580 [bacterium]|nr:hypothetical protein [bacterium]
MSITLLNPGRVSNSLITQRITNAVQLGQAGIDELQTQLATGRKFILPSDSPTAATQTILLQKLDERRAGFQQSIQTNQGFLATTDQTLATISDVIAQARGLAQSAAGDQVSTSEREGFALEIQGLLNSVIQAANTSYGGRYLFAGSATTQAPFELTASGQVRYLGNTQSLSGYADFNLLVSSGVDGASGLAAITKPISGDLNPALTTDTELSQLYRGTGVTPGRIRITLDDGTNTIRKDLDLSSAETVADLQTQIQAAFAAEAITVTVDIDPTSQSGLRITPSAGTVEIKDVQQGTTAQELGIASGPVAVIQGSDLDPSISLYTNVSALNNNTGIGATAGFGLQIVNGGRTYVVDLDGAATVQDIINRIKEADSDLVVGISDDGRGIAISSRLSGSDFSIGENGGNNATLLGLRTFTADAKLDDLNLGQGVPRDSTQGTLSITRRDGTTVDLDLSQATTVQDVLDAINAIDPGVLTASLNTVGNGISLTDTSGTGSLSVAANAMGDALGLSGSETTGSTGVLAGREIHPSQPAGIFGILSSLELAVRNKDLPELQRLASALDAESARVSVVRGSVGIAQRQLDSVDNLLSDRHIEIQGQLEKLVDVDYADAITEFTARQQSLSAYLSVTAQALQLSLLNYL